MKDIDEEELQRDLDAVLRPRKMTIAEALANPDRNRALLAVYQNVSRTSEVGETVAWAYEAMLKVNSSGVPIMFLEWSPAEVSRARGALSEVGALDAVAAIDKVFEYIGVDRQLDDLPDPAVYAIQSKEFEEWERQCLPGNLADTISDRIFEYIEQHVGELQAGRTNRSTRRAEKPRG